MDDWECPECHKAYPVPPKWCPCKPYPMADPYTIYFLLEMDMGIDFDDLMLDAGLQSVISVIAGGDNPFKNSLMILETAGWDGLMPMDDEEDRKEAEASFGTGEHLQHQDAERYSEISEVSHTSDVWSICNTPNNQDSPDVGSDESLPTASDVQGTSQEVPTQPEDLFDRAEHYLENNPSRATPGTSKTGYMLLKENFSPGVETLDYFGWKIVDLTREEYDKLLDMYSSHA